MIIKTLTWNIRHGLGVDNKQDINRIADELLKRNSDIYAIQEVDICTRRSKGIDQLGYLSERLGMVGNFTRFFGYDGGDYGLATFTKYPIINTDELILFSRLSRSNRALHVDMMIEGKVISHINLHLPATRSAICWRNLNKYRHGDKTIITGDFNLNPHANDIQRIKKKFNDINEHTTHPVYDIIDYSFSTLTPIESCVYETIASDHSMLETKYTL